MRLTFQNFMTINNAKYSHSTFEAIYYLKNIYNNKKTTHYSVGPFITFLKSFVFGIP